MSKLIAELARNFGLTERDVRTIVNTAPIRYKSYKIPKRSSGFRIISQPAQEVKLFQRYLVDTIISELPMHDAATAYRVGKSIRDNAALHAGCGALIKFDFSDFFPSIVSTDWINYCQKYNIFSSEDDIHISSNILFHRTKYGSILRLAIGAPSSPGLSNVLLEEFDRTISSEVARDKVRYSRYADDMTFSARRVGNLSNVEKLLRHTIRSIPSPRLRINEAKTVLVTKRHRQSVTGVVLSNDGCISIGRDKKRTLRSAVHHYMTGKLQSEELPRLAGLIAHVNSIEPSFIERLIDRYGIDTINELKRSNTTRRESDDF